MNQRIQIFKKLLITDYWLLIIGCVLFLLGATLVATPVFAQQPAPKKDRSVELINPIGGTVEKPKGETNLQVVVGRAIRKALGIIGSLTLAVFIYGGFLWLTAAGNDEKVHTGTQTMMWAVIGICIIFGAYAILGLVLKSIGG